MDEAGQFRPDLIRKFFGQPNGSCPHVALPGKRYLKTTNTEDWQEAQCRLHERLQAPDQNTLQTIRRGEKLLFNEWVEFFLENYSQPPIRAAFTHRANIMALKHLKPEFDNQRLSGIDADQIERYLRSRLRQRNRVRTGTGYRELGIVKPTTVHQEFRALHRIFNVAVKKETLSRQPMQWGGVSNLAEGALSPSLCFVV